MSDPAAVGGARFLTGIVDSVAADGSLVVTVLGQTGLRVRAVGGAVAGDTVVLLQAGKSFVSLGPLVGAGQAPRAQVFRAYLANPTITTTWWTPSGGIYDASTPYVTWLGGSWVINIQQPGMYACTLLATRMNTLTANRDVHAAVNDRTGNALTWRDIAPNLTGDSPFAMAGYTFYSPGNNRQYQAYFKSPQGALTMGYCIWELTYLGARD